MNRMYRLKLVVFIIIITLTMLACSREWEQRSIWAIPAIEQVEGAIGVADGVYVGVGKGYVGDVHVEVTVRDNAIADVRVITHADTPAFANSVFSALIPEIMARQSTGVDSTAGATHTAHGLIEGIEDALVAAGANLTNLRARAGGDAPAAAAAPALPAWSDSDWPPRFIPGTYTGYGEGFGGEIIVDVTFTAAGISAIQVTEHSETTGFGDRAFQAMIPAMISAGTALVDTTSGATASSEGLIDAVFDAAFEAEE